MTSRPYSDCLALSLALAGVPDSNADEVARVKLFLNRRARRAYGESPFWPRWFVAGEERIVSEEGLLPYAEDGKNDIGTCLRIHATEPYADEPAGEYIHFVAESDGVQIQGYVAREVSDYRAPMRVTGTFSPELDGVYNFTGEFTTGIDEVTVAPKYQSADNEANTLEASLSFTVGTPPTFLAYRWYLRGESGTDYWRSTPDDDAVTPDMATGAYEEEGAAISENGGVTVEKITTYSAWVTYQAAFSVTYGDGDGEEDEVPDEWHDYIAHGACADWLRAEKEYEAAALMEADAFNYLAPHLERVSRQSGQHATTRILTHANLQAR